MGDRVLLEGQDGLAREVTYRRLVGRAKSIDHREFAVRLIPAFGFRNSGFILCDKV